MTRPALYLSSPYGSDPANWLANVNRQERAADAAIRLGYAPIYPLSGHYVSATCRELGHEPPDYDTWMEVSLALVARAEILLRLPGHSPGAEREVAYAISLGLSVYDFHNRPVEGPELNRMRAIVEASR